MESEEIKKCSVCGKELTTDSMEPLFAAAGEWLAKDVWQDAGELCRQCLENRGRLAMMYLREYR